MKTVSILIGVLVLVAGSVYVVSSYHQTTQLIAERGEEENDNETILVLAVKGEEDNETLMQLTEDEEDNGTTFAVKGEDDNETLMQLASEEEEDNDNETAELLV
jgi:Cft2 family RNA processing exonuclease